MEVSLPYADRRTRPPDSPPMSTTETQLIRTPAGWTYPDPGPCPCGVIAAMVGFEFCRCAGALGGGHPAWRCRACDEVRTLGCVGRIEVPNTYGGRS